MIVVYAQAADRQGLDSALNGMAVEDVNPEFIELRERGRSVALANPVQVGEVELRYSRGLARLVFDDAEQDQDGSPITVVIDMNAAQSDPKQAVTAAVDGVRAIRRKADSEVIRAAFKVATEIHASALTRQRIVVAGCIAVVAGIVIATAVLIVGAFPKQ